MTDNLLSEELHQYLDNIDTTKLFNGLSAEEQLKASSLLDTFKNESKVALSLIIDHIHVDQRILEVGAGLCLLSVFLKGKGYQITALEPLDSGFGFFEQLKSRIINLQREPELPVLEKGAESLDPKQDGKFDLIFSNNVVEHIKELPKAMAAMSTVLKADGRMIHGCPNYLMPYEPHFGIPVIASMPSLSKLIWRDHIEANIEVWDSLNFVTYTRIQKIAKQVNCDISFQARLTYDAFSRLQQDTEFQARHKGSLAYKILRLLEITKMLNLTRYLPAWASTPMIFTLTSKRPRND